MSKVQNIFTGELFMTEQNALRHYVVKGRKALKSGDYEKMHKVWKDAQHELNVELCKYCIYDDFDYCGLRRESIDKKEMFVKYCFPSYLKSMEELVKF